MYDGFTVIECWYHRGVKPIKLELAQLFLRRWFVF